MSQHEEKLKLAKEQAEKGDPISVRVHEFLGWFGYERRGWRVVREIRAELARHEIQTQPDFEYAWFHGEIAIVGVAPTSPDGSQDPGDNESSNSDATERGETVAGDAPRGSIEDPAFRIGKLDAANTTPTRVAPTASLSEAVTVMLRENYSQLPVMSGDREVKGAITWQSIAKHVALGEVCTCVQDCMDMHVEIVTENDSLFRVIERIRENDFVLVRNTERRIGGIVTLADLSETLDELGRPFLLLGEIENHIRGLIDGRFTIEELEAAKNPNDDGREVTDVSDLSFGEYVRLIQNATNWQKLALPIDRKTFVQDLTGVNRIRNDVMHFDPDGISDVDLDNLRKCARFLQELRTLIHRREPRNGAEGLAPGA